MIIQFSINKPLCSIYWNIDMKLNFNEIISDFQYDYGRLQISFSKQNVLQIIHYQYFIEVKPLIYKEPVTG